jgi:NADH dehydrogenase
MSKSPPRIVILGGGFGGLYTALRLEKTLARTGEADVVLINRDNFFLFTPMLHEVAASDLDFTHIVNPIRKLLRRVQFFHGDVEAIDLGRRTVRVSHGSAHHDHEVPFDHLVLALGSVTNFYGLPGLESRAVTMKSLGDAIHLRNRLIANLEQADFECCTSVRTPLLTVLVAGGGFAGVETIAAVNDFLHEAIPYYPRLRREDLRLVLVHAGELILPELGPELGAYAERKLAERGVEIRTRTKVVGCTEQSVTLGDGTVIPCDTVVWTAGTSPHPLLRTLPCPMDRGRIRVGADFAVPDWDGLWATGDCASIPNPDTGEPQPPTAQHALREADVLAHNLEAAVRGGARRTFRFPGLGQLAAIGRRTGVARIFGVNFSGFFAWWLWRTIYLAKLPRAEKKLRVMLDWTLDLIFSKDLVQFMTFRSGGESHMLDELAVKAPTAMEPALGPAEAACPLDPQPTMKEVLS